jgi:hypothetical protein
VVRVEAYERSSVAVGLPSTSSRRGVDPAVRTTTCPSAASADPAWLAPKAATGVVRRRSTTRIVIDHERRGD